jgi:uncharacterized membrane protein
MKNTDPKVRWIAEGAVIAALYVVLTMVFAPISFGPVQIRIAEALCIMPLFTSAAIPGLFLGCIIGNLLGGGIMLDVIFGSIATLIGAWIGYLLRSNRWLVPVPAIVSNTLIVPFVLRYGYGVVDVAIPVLMFQILLGEIAGCYVLGELLCTALQKNADRIFKASEDNI